VSAVLLIHGGLWDNMDAAAFWGRPGIVRGLQRHGLEALAPDRPRRPPSWHSEVEDLGAALPDGQVIVVAGSNGCSVAARLALAMPERVHGLLLAWPATAGDRDVDVQTRLAMSDLGASSQVIDVLLGGGSLRGVTDAELSTISPRVGVLPSLPENRARQRKTVDALLRVIPHAAELPGCPEPPSPDFPPHAASFVDAVATFALT
jgi:pimeloyl-ACP methyl ester carboxylesterase